MHNFNIDKNVILKYLQDVKVNDIFNFIDSNRTEFSEFLNWISFIRSEEDEKAYIENLKKDNSNVSFAVLHKGKVIASIGFICIDNLNKNAQIGYCLDKNFQGQGIITKACKNLIKYAFNELHLQRIEFRIAPNNIKSKAVAQRLLANFEGILKKSYFLKGNYIDCEIYSILSDSDI